MATTDRVLQPTGCRRQIPAEHSAPTRVACGSLISDEAWDRYDVASLLPLKEVVQENGEFGFLLRHYWIPATELRFRQSSRTTAPGGNVAGEELWIDRRMVRCYSNECTWRETVRPAFMTDENGSVLEAAATIIEMLCSYDCYEQTYVSAMPVLFERPVGGQKAEARHRALHRLPILVPPGPVPIGYCWYAKVGDDYMNFCLEAEERVGETSTLVVRREGRYTSWLSKGATNASGRKETSPVVTERKGVTLFAWNRGAVLEDRFWDQVVEAERPLASRVGTICHVVTRLVRSCPTE